MSGHQALGRCRCGACHSIAGAIALNTRLCTCLEYGHGMTLTRVHSPWCPLHSATAPELARMSEAELRAGVNAFTEDDPAPVERTQE